MPLAALREILAGRATSVPTGPDIRGADPVLPTRFRVGTAGAAALGALGLAVPTCGELRGWPRPAGRVDLRAAAARCAARATCASTASRRRAWDPMSGFYPVRDGWISIHCNFAEPPRRRAEAFSSTKEDRAAAEQATRAWEGEALEDAIHAAAGCAGLRAQSETLGAPSARAGGRRPAADRDPAASAMRRRSRCRRRRPLAGVRVLDLTRVLAGPDLRAQPRRARRRRAEDQRRAPPGLRAGGPRYRVRQALGAPRPAQEKGVYPVRPRRARPTCSRSPTARARSPRAASRREALAALRPGIVCVSLSAWGRTGPWRARRGFDSIVQAVSGMAHALGDGGEAAAPAGLGYRLRERLPDGVRRHGGARAPRPRGRQLAGARRARPRRPLDRRPGRAAG